MTRRHTTVNGHGFGACVSVQYLLNQMKRLGKKKADVLNEAHPGMTLSSWLELNFTHVTFDKTVSQGGSRLVVKPHNIELTVALLSTSNVADWARVAFHWAPAGTIIDKVPNSYYEEKVLLLRQLLTKQLLVNPDNKMAQRYLQILERRDAERWAQKKQAMNIRAAATTEQKSEGGGNGSKKIVFDFEIV